MSIHRILGLALLASAPLAFVACTVTPPNGLSSSAASTGSAARSDASAPVPEGDGTKNRPASPAAADASAASSRVVGVAGIAAWDALSASEQSQVKAFKSIFLHQSVGADLEDGARALGFEFDYAAATSTSIGDGLSGGLFMTSNGNGVAKISEWRDMALANQAGVRVATMKFGYADIVDDKLTAVEAAYQDAVTTLRAAGIRVLHVTPPLVYDAAGDNAPKMQMRSWMMATFPNDTIFDLQDLQSTEPASGARCQRGGSWEICDSVRSTVGCPSLGQGIDAPSGQGHLCFDPHAKRLAKAFLFAIREAGK